MIRIDETSSRPGCHLPGYLCDVHHCTPYCTHPATDINNLTFACGTHHTLADHGWTPRNNTHGHTQWIPPPHHDRGQPRINTYPHPEKLLQGRR